VRDSINIVMQDKTNAS